MPDCEGRVIKSPGSASHLGARTPLPDQPGPAMSQRSDGHLTAHARLELAQAARMWRIVADSRRIDVEYWRERGEKLRADAAETRWRDAERRAAECEKRVLALPEIR